MRASGSGVQGPAREKESVVNRFGESPSSKRGDGVVVQADAAVAGEARRGLAPIRKMSWRSFKREAIAEANQGSSANHKRLGADLRFCRQGGLGSQGRRGTKTDYQRCHRYL